MTDDNLDEIASAHLDGAASTAEAARLAADPDGRARVDALGSVRARLQDIEINPALREASLAAALAVFDEERRAATADLPTLAAVRARRFGAFRAPAVVGAAAAVVLLALLVPVLSRLDRGDSSQTAARDVPVTGDRSTGDPPEVAGGSASAGAASTTTTAGPPKQAVDLGAFDSFDALAAAMASGGADATTETAPEFGGIGAPPCLQADSQVRSDAVGAVRSASVDDVPVYGVLTVDPAGTRTLRIFRATDCALVDLRSLPRP